MRRFFLFLLLASRVSAQETMIREVYDPKTDTNVEVLALFSKTSPGGFLPVRVKISNNLKFDKTIYLNFESNTEFSQGNHTSSSFSFTAASGKAVTRDILVPLSPSSSSGGWRSLETRMSGGLGDAQNNFNTSSDTPVLLSEALYTPNASLLDAALGSSGRYGGKTEFAAKFDPKQLPDNWLAFSGYDSVLMTDTDWSATPAGARNAILAWARMGGQLVIYFANPVDRKALRIPEDLSYGTSVLQAIPSSLKLDPAETLKLVKSNPNKPRSESRKTDFDGSWPLQDHFGSQTFRYGMFIVVLIIFAVMVGPVNLFVFAKSGQRHRLFLTTPVISLAASLILIGLIIAQDGFGGSGMRRVLMEVRPDGDQNAAFVRQEQFCRTGVLTGSRFTMDEACAFSPVPIAQSRWARFTNSTNSRSSFNLQPTDGRMEISGDWFQSRSEHGHEVSAVVSTRGRIEATGSPHTFLSTFDFSLEKLFYLDADGQWYRAESVTTGKRFTMTPVDFSMVDPVLQAESNGYSAANKQMLDRVRSRPGCYIAITGDAPGVPTHPGIRWKETRSVITGPVL